MILFLLLPIRSIINSCYRNDQAEAAKTFKEVVKNFQQHYDVENPVTKSEGLLRLMELRISSAETEDEKDKLRNQIKQVSGASVMDAFSMYSQ